MAPSFYRDHEGIEKSWNSQRRQHEELVAIYLQRYCVKNDTIGFFGPLGYGELTDVGPAVEVRPEATLAVRDGVLPPSLHFETPNPEIDFESSPFYLNTKLAPWRPGATPRRAGVSSFSLGGVNSHVILEEPPAAAAPTPGRC